MKKCHSEFTTLLVADYKEACKGGYSKSISGSYQLETKASRWQDAETVLNFPYGSGNPLLGFALRSQNFACGALPHVGFFCSLTGLVSLRPSANPLHSVKTFSFYFCLVFAFSRTSVCFAAAVANYCPLIFGLGYFVSHRPTQKRFTCFSPFRHSISLQPAENPQFSMTGLINFVKN